MSNEKPDPNAVAKPETAAEQQPAKLISLQRSRLIGQGLRAIYGEVVGEPVPDAFLDILKEADEKAASAGKKDELPASGGAKIFVLGANVSSGPQNKGG